MVFVDSVSAGSITYNIIIDILQTENEAKVASTL